MKNVVVRYGGFTGIIDSNVYYTNDLDPAVLHIMSSGVSIDSSEISHNAAGIHVSDAAAPVIKGNLIKENSVDGIYLVSVRQDNLLK